MANRIYRRSAVQSVGNFDNNLRWLEFPDMDWKLKKTGYKIIVDERCFVFHLKSPQRFTLKHLIRKRIQYGYWYHMLFYTHPNKVNLGGWPIKLVFLILVLFLIPFPLQLYLILVISSIYLTIRVYRRKECFVACLKCMNSFTGKLKAVAVILLIEVLDVASSEIGKVNGILGKLKHKTHVF